MSIENKVFSGDTLRVGYRFQRYWDNSMAYAFFCAEVGAGLYFVSLLLDSLVGMAVGFVVVSTGKPYFHLAHMGVPAKSWRAMLRPDRSWISRGVWLLAGLDGHRLFIPGGPVFRGATWASARTRHCSGC